MRRAQNLTPRLQRLAAEQAGILTTHQLMAGGITRHGIARLSSGWRRMADGVHLIGPATWESAAWAGLLRGGEDAVIGADGAAYLHGILRDAPSTIHIWAPVRRSALDVGGVQVAFKRGRRSGLGLLRRASVEVAVADMAAHSDEDATVAVVAGALAAGKTTPTRMLDQLGARAATRHSAIIRQLCSAGGEGIESALEWRFQQRVLRPHGLPLPERQVRIRTGRIDTMYREQSLLIELDGLRDHSNWSKDMFRDNEHLLVDGLATLRYGWHAVTGSACGVAQQVADALALRGWRGALRRCRRCQEDVRCQFLPGTRGKK